MWRRTGRCGRSDAHSVPVRTFRLRAMREDRGRFAALRDERVLIYWPHGLGDWVHVAAILPLFEPSNAYAIARFGDDYSCVLEGNPYARRLESGSRSLDDGSSLGARHLGLRRRALNGSVRGVMVPEPLAQRVADFDPTALLWTDYPETEGRTPFPFHTKARNLARSLVASERLESFDLWKPLPTTIDFGAARELQAAVDERFERVAPPGTHRVLLSVCGYTALRKNWDLFEARRFVDILRRRNAKTRVITMDSAALGDESAWPGREIVISFREAFGEIDAPFARVFAAVLSRIDALAGVPAGPLHVAMARGGMPIAGIWHAHVPEWYDEPNPDSTHVVGSLVKARGFDRRAATTTLPPGWHRKIAVDTPVVPAEAVVTALER